MASIQSLAPLIYHEKQQPGSMLCAQHALNALLQGNYFSAVDLSEIARHLDTLEQDVREDTRRTSSNMDDTGFFSVQVIERALQVMGLTLVPWRSEAMKPFHDQPHTQIAFILNSNQHWYTLRRFGAITSDPSTDPGEGHWFNLDSMLPEPQWVGKLYLGMFLQQAEQEGYSVFAVLPTDPTTSPPLARTEADELAASIPDEPASSFYSKARSSSSSGPASSSAHQSVPEMEGLEDEDMELQAALQASLMGDAQFEQYTPHRTHSAPFAEPPRLPPQGRSFTVPIHAPGSSSAHASGTRTPTQGQPSRRYTVEEPEEMDEDDDEDYHPSRPFARPQTNRFAVPSDPIPALDPVEASRRRGQAMMERMMRQQQMAMQETFEEEEMRSRITGQRRQTAQEREEEELRRAIEESRRLHEAQSGAVDDDGLFEKGDDDDDDEEFVDALETHDVPPDTARPGLAQGLGSRGADNRVYDDEDAELQAALRASLETVPPGFRLPSTPPRPQRQPSLPPSAASQPQPPSQPEPQREREPSAETEPETETESEADTGSAAESIDFEEMRRRRLARFGGS
ncbi:Josephin-domain-containing protein [Panus rudis PR-1116 ss-1]|nr:Josephin-domain-containing protein [Panus rudis PR-1116 ss-1]